MPLSLAQQVGFATIPGTISDEDSHCRIHQDEPFEPK
jgi:hypothetical protein